MGKHWVYIVVARSIQLYGVLVGRTAIKIQFIINKMRSSLRQYNGITKDSGHTSSWRYSQRNKISTKFVMSITMEFQELWPDWDFTRQWNDNQWSRLYILHLRETSQSAYLLERVFIALSSNTTEEWLPSFFLPRIKYTVSGNDMVSLFEKGQSVSTWGQIGSNEWQLRARQH